VTEDSGKLINGKLHTLYFPLSTIRMIRSRRMRWTGHDELEEECIYTYDIGGKNQRRLLGRPRSGWI
jgi:hypothetical protein